MNLFKIRETRHRETHREQTYSSPGGEDGEGIVREFGADMYTLLYLKWIMNKDLLDSTGTLLNVTWQPGLKGSLGENRYTYIHG